MEFTKDSIDQYLNWLWSQGRSQNTVRAYRADLTGLMEWVTDPTQPLEEVMARYVTTHRRTWAPKTTGRKITALRSYALWSGSDALKGYNAPTPPRATPHPLPEGVPGVLRMIDVATVDHHRALIALCGLAGLRVGEALTVRASDIDPDRRTLYVRGKGDHHRVVPLSDRAWPIIAPVWATRYATNDLLVTVSERVARDIITRLGKRAGLSRTVSSHDLRATFATAAYQKTKDLRAVQDLLGHASSVTTELYTLATEESMRTAAAL